MRESHTWRLERKLEVSFRWLTSFSIFVLLFQSFGSLKTNKIRIMSIKNKQLHCNHFMNMKEKWGQTWIFVKNFIENSIENAVIYHPLNCMILCASFLYDSFFLPASCYFRVWLIDASFFHGWINYKHVCEKGMGEKNIFPFLWFSGSEISPPVQTLQTFPEYVTAITMFHVEPSQAVFRSDGDDPGSCDLFRQYCRDKEMLKDDDPFLLIRGGL